MAAHQLQLFESTKDIYLRSFRRLRPRTTPPEITVLFKPYANANCYIRWRNQRLEVRHADVLRNAPGDVIEAIAMILLCKIYRQRTPPEYLDRYQTFMNAPETRLRLEALRRARGRKQVGSPEGAHFDLTGIFHELNEQYFAGQLSVPRIGWSARPSKRVLGHYDPIHHAIIISRALDSHEAGLDLVRYVMFHEMLHIKHPIQYGTTRRTIHSEAFRKEEAAYPHFRELKEKLRDFCHGTRRKK